MRFNILLLLTIVFVFGSCKNRKLITSEDGILLELPDNAFSKVSRNLPEFEFLSLKAKSSFKTKDASQSFTLILKMRRDSFIWASVSGFGFEAVRALITTDSVTVIDRLNKTYYKESIDYLSTLIGFDVNLSQLQNILIGNPPISGVDYLVTNHETYHAHLRAVNGTLESILQLNSQFQVNRSRMEQMRTKEVLDIRYLNHSKIKGLGEIPEDLEAKVSSGERNVVEITLHYTSVDTDKFDNLPIQIPKNYEKGT